MAAPAARRQSGGMPLVLLGRYARGALDGPCAPAEAGRQVVGALDEARTRQVSRLLIDLSALAFTQAPGVAERYGLGSEIARVGQGMRRIAVVLQRDALALYGFTFLVATNLGLPTAGFVDEAQALAWLLGPPGGGGPRPDGP